ncbi:MAG: Nif3-like dinuclear metal center hexameric protein [Muribaculaceae bacterium]
MIRVSDIIQAIEDFAPLHLQEPWDNTGLQVGDASAECTGVMLCVDVTEHIIAEACRRGCNMVVSHHPLLFKGLKSITGATVAERAVIAALRSGVAIYSSHTAMDSTRGGVSHEMAKRLGARVTAVLSPIAADAGDDAVGLGVVADFDVAISRRLFIDRVKAAFGSPIVRSTQPVAPDVEIHRIAMCGGAGGEFIAKAVAAGAQAYITSDTRYHDFIDYRHSIWIIDIGHYESECCTKDIFYRVISEKIPNFAVYYSDTEDNPIKYIK